MTAKQFQFGVDIPTKINKYSRRFVDLQGFLDENYDGEHHMLWDKQEECWVHLDEALELMEKEYSNIEKENEQLKKENKELRQDNDIKFWKLQCLQSSNNNQVMLFELSRAIQQGYEVSDKFKQYLDEIKEHDKEIREKHKRLFGKSERDDFCICLDCKHQWGIWINDRELDTYCELEKSPKANECDYFEGV